MMNNDDILKLWVHMYWKQTCVSIIRLVAKSRFVEWLCSEDVTGRSPWRKMTKTVNYSSYLLSALGAVVAATFYQYLVVLGRWRYIDDLPRENFNLANFKVRKIDEIKTTYYSTGHLGDVLKEVCFICVGDHILIVLRFHLFHHSGHTPSSICFA